MKFATKPIQHYPSHLRRVATLPWEIKNSNLWTVSCQLCTCAATSLTAY